MKKALLFIGGTLIGAIIGAPAGLFLFGLKAGDENGCKITRDGHVIWGDPDARKEESDSEE